MILGVHGSSKECFDCFQITLRWKKYVRLTSQAYSYISSLPSRPRKDKYGKWLILMFGNILKIFLSELIVVASSLYTISNSRKPLG